MSRARGPLGVTVPVDFGMASLVPDPDRRGGWTLLLDRVPQSYVDANDATHLEFEYVRRLASVVDLATGADGTPDGPLRVLHLGGGAMTLPRYVAHARPGSVQRVVERDAALTALVRRVLPLARGANVRVRAADARAVVETSAPWSYDVVVADVYGGARMAAKFTTTEFAAAVARVLRPGGVLAANLADGPPLSFARAQVATVGAVFPDVCLMAEPGVLRRRRFGNLVVAATTEPGRLPVAELARAAARDPFPARLLHGPDLMRFTAGARPVTDATAVDSPAPPASLFA